MLNQLNFTKINQLNHHPIASLPAIRLAPQAMNKALDRYMSDLQCGQDNLMVLPSQMAIPIDVIYFKSFVS